MGDQNSIKSLRKATAYANANCLLVVLNRVRTRHCLVVEPTVEAVVPALRS